MTLKDETIVVRLKLNNTDMDYHTTMIADSRVRYLQEELSRLSGLHIPVISKSGTDFGEIDRELNHLTHWNKVSALLAGVNETTRRDPVTERVSAVHSSHKNLCEDIT